jgi:hypothetical protein
MLQVGLTGEPGDILTLFKDELSVSKPSFETKVKSDSVQLSTVAGENIVTAQMTISDTGFSITSSQLEFSSIGDMDFTAGGDMKFNHSVGDAGQVLTSQGGGNPVWAAPSWSNADLDLGAFKLTCGQSVLEPTKLTIEEDIYKVEVCRDKVLLTTNSAVGGISNDMYTGISLTSNTALDLSVTGGNLTFNHSVGLANQVLTSQGSGNPVWAALPGPWVPRGVYDPTWVYALGDMVYFKFGPGQSQGLYLRQADPGVLDTIPGDASWLTIFLYEP